MRYLPGLGCILSIEMEETMKRLFFACAIAAAGIATPSFALGPIDGWYECTRGCSGKTRVLKGSGNSLIFINERGHRSLGHFVTPRVVQASNWPRTDGQVGLRGDYDGSCIRWRNTTEWCR